MSETDHERLTRLFLAASRIDPDRREAFVDEQCGDDQELRDELTGLLDQGQKLPPILDRVASDRDIAHSIRIPHSIGPYRIVKQIGAGGMGVVYLAEQKEPVQRRVALKLIRPGYETTSVLARFQAERRVLSLLDHPAIARILDAGDAGDGRPYFAMELVEGRPITRYCDERNLSIRRRLEVFCRVCDAVQHAHQNSVIHRDLKPSNVLVSTIDGEPVPKIIDFGVAKLLGSDPGVAQGVTLAEQPIGTPEYMSPEQAGLDSRPPDTRADVYSLGCILYELLVGSGPFAQAEWASGSAAELLRLAQREAPTPSVHVTRLASSSSPADPASRRGVTPAGLVRRLRGDLDCIVARCLANEREQRYASAAGLADDLRRHLHGDPIEARPAGAWYRLGKLARKHRTASLLAAVVLPLLAIFAVAMTAQAGRTARERDQAQELADFLVNLWEAPHFVSGRHAPPEVAELLMSLPARSEERFSGRPVLQARFAQGIGNLFRIAGDPARALPLLQNASSVLERELGAEHPSALQARLDLAQGLAISGSIDEALDRFDEVVAVHLRVLGDRHPASLRALAHHGFWLKVGRRFDASAERLETAYAGLEQQLGVDADETLTAAALLGAVYLELHRFEEARRLLAATEERMAAEHPEYFLVLYNLAAVHAQLGQPDVAERFLERSVDAGMHGWFYTDTFFVPLHDRSVFDALARRARLRQRYEPNVMVRAESAERAGDFDEAERIHRYLLKHGSPELDDRCYGGLLRLARAREATDETVAIYREVLERDTRRHGSDSTTTAATTWFLGVALIDDGDHEGGAALLNRAHGILAGDPRLSGWTRYLEAQQAALRGDRDGALVAFRRAADAGFNLVPLLEHDPALGHYLNDPGFAEIRETILRRYRYP